MNKSQCHSCKYCVGRRNRHISMQTTYFCKQPGLVLAWSAQDKLKQVYGSTLPPIHFARKGCAPGGKQDGDFYRYKHLGPLKVVGIILAVSLILYINK